MGRFLGSGQVSVSSKYEEMRVQSCAVVCVCYSRAGCVGWAVGRGEAVRGIVGWCSPREGRTVEGTSPSVLNCINVKILLIGKPHKGSALCRVGSRILTVGSSAQHSVQGWETET